MNYEIISTITTANLLMDKLNNNGVAIEYFRKTVSNGINSFHLLNPRIESTMSLSEAEQAFMDDIDSMPADAILDSLMSEDAVVTIADVYENPSLYIDELINNVSNSGENSKSSVYDLQAYFFYLLQQPEIKKQILAKVFSGAKDMTQASSQIGGNTTTISQKDRINALMSWQLSVIPLMKNGVPTKGFVSQNLISADISDIVKSSDGYLDFLKILIAINKKVASLAPNTPRRLHLESFSNHLTALFEKAERLKGTQYSAEINSFLNGISSNRGSQVIKDVEITEVLYDNENLVKVQVKQRHLNESNEYAQALKDNVGARVMHEDSIQKRIQKEIHAKFSFDKNIGIISKETMQPFIIFFGKNKWGDVKEMSLNKSIAPQVFENFRRSMGFNMISQTSFTNFIGLDTTDFIPGIDKVEVSHTNLSGEEFMGFNMGMFLVLTMQNGIVDQLVTNINSYSSKIAESVDIVKLVGNFVSGRENDRLVNAFNKIAVKNFNQFVNDASSITGRSIIDEVKILNDIASIYFKKFPISRIGAVNNSGMLLPQDLFPLFNMMGLIKANDSDTNAASSYRDAGGSRRQKSSPRSPGDLLTPENFANLLKPTPNSLIHDANGKLLSMFPSNQDWVVRESIGITTGKFGTAEPSSTDRIIADFAEFQRLSNSSRLRIPLIPFGASMRSQYLHMKLNASESLTSNYSRLFKNGLERTNVAHQRSKRLYSESLKNAAERLTAFESNPVLLGFKNSIVNLSERIDAGMITNPLQLTKEFMNIQNAFESAVSSEAQEETMMKEAYVQYYTAIRQSDMEGTMDYQLGDTMFYYGNGEYQVTDETKTYTPIQRLFPGNAMRFGYQINQFGEKQEVSLGRGENRNEKYVAYSSRLWNYDNYQKSVEGNLKLPEDIKLLNESLKWDMDAFGRFLKSVWNQLPEKTRGKGVFQEIEDEGEARLVLDQSNGSYDFFMSTVLYGEEFNATALGSHLAYQSHEDNIKRLKQTLTGCTYGNDYAEDGLENNFDVIHISSEQGFVDFGNGVTGMQDLTDGNGILSSLANRLFAQNLGGKYSMFTGGLMKPLASRFHATKGESASLKLALFDPISDMIELAPQLRRIQVVLLNNTTITLEGEGTFRLGDRYESYWDKGFNHDQIIDKLIYEYQNATSKVGNLALKFASESVVKITPKRINVGTLEDLYKNSKAGNQPLSRTHSISDLGLIYNPEINMNENTEVRKDIQQEFILPIIDKIYGRQINSILVRMNDFAHDAFVEQEGIDLRTFAHRDPTKEEADKLLSIARKYTVNALQGQKNFGTTMDMVRFLSPNIAPVFETIMQNFVNKHANKFGHTKKIAGDRVFLVPGHYFEMIEKDGRLYNIMEYQEFFNDGQRLTDEDLKSLGAKPIDYMRIKEGEVSRGQVVMNFKYSELFNLRQGEQPGHLYSIWKNKESGGQERIDLRDGLESFDLKIGDLKRSYASQIIDDKWVFMEEGIEIPFERYASQYYTYMAKNNDVYDHDKSPLLRMGGKYNVDFSDKVDMLMNDNILNTQSGRIPWTVHSYASLETVVAFTNQLETTEWGDEKYKNANIKAKNGRNNKKDGSDFDGDAGTDTWRNITQYEDEHGFIRYHAKNSDMAMRLKIPAVGFKSEANSLFDKHEEILNDPNSYPFSFFESSTSDLKKVKNAKVSKSTEAIDGSMVKTGVLERTNPFVMYNSDALNSSDKHLIGIFAQNMNVAAELSQLQIKDSRQVSSFIEIPTDLNEIREVIVLFDTLEQAVLDGEKDSISGPMGLISEFGNMMSLFMLERKIKRFMLPDGGEYQMKDKNSAYLTNEVIWDFLRQPVMSRLRSRVLKGRQLMNSSFTHSLLFSIEEEIKSTIDKYRVADSDLAQIGMRDINLDIYDEFQYQSIKNLYDTTTDENQRRIANKLMNLMKDVRILNELSLRMPVIESFYGMGFFNSLRKTVWSKTSEMNDVIHRAELLIGMKLDNAIDLFFNKDGSIRPYEEFKKLNSNYSQRAIDFYMNNSQDFLKKADGTFTLRSEEASKYDDVYMEFIKNKFEQVDYAEYLYKTGYTLFYLKNLAMDKAVSGSISKLNSPEMKQWYQMHFDRLSANYWNYKSEEVSFNDQFQNFLINQAVASIYEGKPISMNTWKNGDTSMSIVNAYSGLDLSLTENRSRLILQTPELTRAFSDIADKARTGDMTTAKIGLDSLVNSNDWLFSEEQKQMLLESMKNDSFLKNVEFFGSGSLLSIKFKSQDYNEDNADLLLKQRGSFAKYPQEFQDIIGIYNVLRYGYRPTKTFFEVAGPKTISKIDSYLVENIDGIIADAENSARFLQEMYSLPENLPFGTKRKERGVAMSDFSKMINITPGQEGKGFAKTPVHFTKRTISETTTDSRTGEKVTTPRDIELAVYSKYPNMGGNYSAIDSRESVSYTEAMVVKSLSAEQLGDFLKYGHVTISSRGGYPGTQSINGVSQKVPYVISNVIAYARRTGDEVTFTKSDTTDDVLRVEIKNSSIRSDVDNRTRLEEERFKAMMVEGNKIFKNTSFYDVNMSEASLQSVHGNNYIIVSEGIYESLEEGMRSGFAHSSRVLNSFQFKKNAISLKVNSSHRMYSIPEIKTNSVDPEYQQVMQERKDKQVQRIKQTVDKFKADLTQAIQDAERDGKMILLPNFTKRGFGFALADNSYLRPIYDDLSKFLYENFGYKNMGMDYGVTQALVISNNPKENMKEVFNKNMENIRFKKHVIEFLSNPSLKRITPGQSENMFKNFFDEYVSTLKAFDPSESNIFGQAKQIMRDEILTMCK